MRRWLDLLKGFGNVFVKELKELVRDPKILLGMIVIPLIMFPVLGALMGFSMESAKEQAEKASFLVLDNDQGNWSKVLINSFALYVRVDVVNDTQPQQVIDQNLLAKHNASQFLEIPPGFSANMTAYVNSNKTTKAEVNFYGVFSGTGIFEGIGSSMADNLVYQFNRGIAPDAVLSSKSSIIKGAIVTGVDPQTISSLMMSQAIAMPITIMILLSYSMQVAATSVAMEKEEKTLETLLTLPVDRFSILMGKLSGSILVAGVGALTYMIGFNFYMGSFYSAIPTGSLDLVALGLVPSVFGYALLAVSLFVTLLSALALAVIMSAFAEDVRGAQSLVGYVYLIVYIPSIVLMFADINMLPLPVRVLIYAIPFSHPIIASKAVIMGDYLTPTLGIIYVTTFTLVVMYAASRLFATEKILTAKLKFKRFGRRGKTQGELE